MVSEKVKIKEKSGLHFRPAGLLSEEALKYDSEITFTCREISGNMKSFLSILAACIKNGDEIEIICSGSDEKEALSNILNILNNELSG